MNKKFVIKTRVIIMKDYTLHVEAKDDEDAMLQVEKLFDLHGERLKADNETKEINFEYIKEE